MDKKRYAGVIVRHDNKILFCKRNSKNSFPGMWSIPGGSMEEGENSQESAKREFFEETAINIDSENLDYVGVIPRHTRDGKKIKGFMYIYLLEPEEKIYPDLNSAIDGEEHTECKYMSLKEIKPDITGEALYKIAKNLLK